MKASKKPAPIYNPNPIEQAVKREAQKEYEKQRQEYLKHQKEQRIDYSRTLIKRAEMARKKEDVIPLSESEKAMEFYKRPAYAGTMLCMDSAWRPGAPEYERRRRKEV